MATASHQVQVLLSNGDHSDQDQETATDEGEQTKQGERPGSAECQVDTRDSAKFVTDLSTSWPQRMD